MENPIDVRIGRTMNEIEDTFKELYPRNFKTIKNSYEVLLYHLALTNLFILDEKLFEEYSEFINSLTISRQIANEKNSK